MDLFENEKRKPEILLLDYQATLVSNFHERNQWQAMNKNSSYTEWIKRERLRRWIPELAIREGLTVILITARSDKYRKVTIDHINECLDWLPDEWYFNELNVQPHICKKNILEKYIYPKHGTDKSKYMAFESNSVTRSMYKKENIYSLRVGDVPLKSVPKVF